MSGKLSGNSWRQAALAWYCLGALTGTAYAQSSSQALGWGDYLGAAAGVPNFGDVGLKVFGGQQLHRYFGWEASIMRFAREVNSTPLGDVRTDFWGVSGAAVGILPVNSDFSAFAKLGAMAGRKRVRGPGGDNDDNALNLLVGIGARYALTPRAAIRAEYEDFNQGNLISVGVTYKF
jgi:opacity protein-like surface antigen